MCKIWKDRFISVMLTYVIKLNSCIFYHDIGKSSLTSLMEAAYTRQQVCKTTDRVVQYCLWASIAGAGSLGWGQVLGSRISLLFSKVHDISVVLLFCGHTFVDFSIKRSADLDTLLRNWVSAYTVQSVYRVLFCLFDLHSPERKENIWRDSLVSY